ncbi:hypothetical protein SCLCIDRAFT_32319 [Scleroderma citrinum Foug A]|uniref:Uncharacterized protein n=1 Tax=Scleroderma citrinum Foug A TaxID=1036808 RepID=A0A0C3D8X3_9AGAM|nr:hypothetical protein SCLCIDRAFT_32319 [Scleroderma citrinum Foug A]
MPTCPKCLKHFDTTKKVVSATTTWDQCIIEGRSPSPFNTPTYDFLPTLEINQDYIGPDTFSNSRENRPLSPTSFAKSLLPQASDDVGRVAVYFSGAGLVYKIGATFINQFDADLYSTYQQINTFYPFSDLNDWQMANFLLTSKLSMSTVDKFLSLEAAKKMLLSFRTAKDLRAWAELLPSGP